MTVTDILRDALGKQEGCTDDYQIVFHMIDKVMDLGKLTRKEGLLALEDAITQLTGALYSSSNDEDINDCYNNLEGAQRILAVLVLLIVDGTEPEIVEMVGISRYYSASLNGREAIAACIAVSGVLHIQQGCNLHLLKQILLAMLPEDAEKQYLKNHLISQNQQKVKETEIPASFFEEKDITNVSGFMGSFNLVISSMGSASIQRILKELDNVELTVVLKGMDGASRKKIFDNLSNHLGKMIYEDMQYMGPVLLEDVENVAINILKKVEKLEADGEIYIDEMQDNRKSIGELMALYEHKILCQNREIELKIKELETEISRLKKKVIKL